MLRGLRVGAGGQGPGASQRRPLTAFIGMLLLAPGPWPLLGAIFPEQIGGFTRGATKDLVASDQALYQEYGLKAAEQADYTAPGKQFTATGWRFRDSTGAFALYESQRANGPLFLQGNYVFRFTGAAPEAADLEPFYAQLPQLDHAPLPALIGFLPKEGLIPNSERYILGPVSLDRFESRISPSIAAFHLGAEAQLGRYRTPKGDLTLIIFNYPTPKLSRDRQEAFQTIPGAVAKRSGPLLAVIVQPPDPDTAEKVLGQVQYQVNLTSNEEVPANEAKGVARLVLTGFALAGFLGGLSIVVGVGFGGFRFVLRKLGRAEDFDGLISLRIGDK